MSSAKETYRQFCETSTRPLIFQTPIWLDAIVGSQNWDVLLSFKGDILMGAMPIVTSSKYGLSQITLPFLTPYLGPIINFPSDLKQGNYLAHKRKVIIDLVAQIPKTDRFVTQTDFEFDYWLPFSWKGYEQTTRYSYLLETKLSLDDILTGFKPNIKKHIKNTQSTFTISESNSVEELYKLHHLDLQTKGIDIHFSKQEFLNLDQKLKSENKRKIIHAINDDGKIACAFYLVFDQTYTHYLIGSVSQEARNSGVMSLMMWEAIKESKTRGLIFNFEGSMNQNIERFFSSFGAEIKPYMKISKVSNKWLKHFTMFNQK